MRAVVAHEPPLARVHPAARRWQRFFASVYLTAFRSGSSLALLRFLFGIQVPVRQLIAASPTAQRRAPRGEHRISRRDASDILVKHELLPVTSYLPDVERIRHNGVAVFMAAGA